METKDTRKPAMRSFTATLQAVAWSFIGIRRRKDYEHDAVGLNPLYVLGAGLLGTAVFIGVLLAVVHHVVP